MSSLLFWIIAAATLAFIFWPFWRRRVALEGVTNGVSSRLADLLAQRDNLLAAIKDIEFDYEMGKISKEDFEQIREQYRRQAIDLFKRIDAARGQSIPRQKLETELQLLRQQRGGGSRFCPACGAPAPATHRFCSHCGEKLSG